jgi:hypothetical protein
MHESPRGPSTSGSVLLELGPGVGALVLHTPPELDGAEIEISLSTQPDAASAKRTHSRVRRRITPGGTKFAAVYPDLAAGEYTIWRDAIDPAMTVTVDGGQVTSAWWPDDVAARAQCNLA